MMLFVILSAVLCAVAAVPTNRVVGGTDAKNGSAPFMVSVQDKDNFHYCGGSILNKRWVLTAAHCVKPNYHHYIYVGSNNVEEGGKHYEIEDGIVHEKYDTDDTMDYDIGLFKVKEDFEFNDNVQPLNLHQETLKGDEKNLRAIGWGNVAMDDDVYPTELQELYVDALPDDECRRYLKFDVPTHMCTLLKENYGVCSGDSGGPLLLDGEQVGIASFVLRSCALGYPDYFTRVSLFLDWIEEHVNEE